MELDTGAQLDHEALAARLAHRFADEPPLDYIDGKTAIRDQVVLILGCSVARAEDIVDELSARGLIAFEGNPATVSVERGAWVFPGH